MPDGSVPGSDDDPVVDPPVPAPRLRGDGATGALPAARGAPRTLSSRPGRAGRGRVGPSTTTSPGSTRASRWASGSSSRPGARRRGRPVREHAGGNLAGERGRRYDHDRGQPSRAARPELHRRGPRASPTTRALPLRHHQAGRLSMGNHANAWRPAHIHFSLFGPAFVAPAGHADVLPRRPAAGRRPDLQVDPGPTARERLIARFDRGRDRRSSARSATNSTSSCGRPSTRRAEDE